MKYNLALNKEERNQIENKMSALTGEYEMNRKKVKRMGADEISALYSILVRRKIITN
jgi:hypothetical protein